MKRALGILIFGALAVVLAASGILIFGGIGSQGDWAKLSAELRAEGLEVEWANILPSPVPDDQNYFAHPVVRALVPERGASSSLFKLAEDAQPLGAPQFPPDIQGASAPYSMEWLRSLPQQGPSHPSIETLEAWFSRWDSALAGFAEAAERPHAVMPGSYTNALSMPIPDLPAIRNLAQFIASRARLHLVQGVPAKAADDLEALAGLARALTGRPAVMVNTQVYISLIHVYVEVVQTGLQERLWTEPELRRILGSLQRFTPLKTTRLSLVEGELAGGGFIISQHGIDPVATRKKFSLQRLSNRMQPKVWTRQNRIAHASALRSFIGALNPTNGLFDVQAHQSGFPQIKELTASRSIGKMVASITLPDLKKIGPRAAEAQTLVNHAVIACALELRKIQEGDYPLHLDSLSPWVKRLPVDVISGKLPIYKPEGNRYSLYSVGLDQRDDQGDPSLDWVWGE